ncbi:Transcriptional regulator GlxA family, contains an amidase domain and an AraC-type DNA-binding HTH domain [Catalinimonas alkaloidigena]|uniref:Transcriptional regulator GlxA family, contains an amidase domain and an AraC-type DNA-binding HTH domain n=1 Tax=Catalinimonas alkaloidigena TaxID=1075417 RepID=A0A1G8X6Y5_9BACT|nr:helix-turn-helix domain-containing protein [Catalinimonas alkaloidigena]SDJ85585.1 Transcriptional regulator GlxA family, contains an amidase domain and an AraC-type DNA-binding HTH domain [Catalinimonas alkaloidigena]
MKNIAILVPETGVLAAIVDPRYMFTAVNDFLKSAGKPPLFHVQLVGLTKEVKLNDGLFSVHTDAQLTNANPPDLILVPAISGHLQSAIQRNQAFFPWIVQQYQAGAEVASLCLGAFLLASTGLLDGKSCSTHWLYANEFRTMFPEVTLVDDRIVTEQNGVYSSGGASSYWNLLLHLVEKYTDRATAILASKFFVLDLNRDTQSPFSVFKGQRNHNDAEIAHVQEFIEGNFQDKITVDQLAEAFGIGRRTLERRFKKATQNTVVEYIQRVKIEASKKQLELSRKTISEVMYDVGYNDNKAFRDVFRKIAGVSPMEYRDRYNKDKVA